MAAGKDIAECFESLPPRQLVALISDRSLMGIEKIKEGCDHV
jgi:hypothetical protein